ncbi:FAD binding domain-containing protein [Aquabacter spiritensis]|uniref:Carbon-monoxide dehydrogenase medium subunit n=1 Tax=Aquabacter spiritensis TaxID=933073 RepID=A0A4R3LZJ6_9HYPH|nr:FAD binding domain-containing protein [Aquabacter spiritensis]TCT04197.1 carbon-monoxide dehydrogenase medium subunit [Aquabacter spiritensis]
MKPAPFAYARPGTLAEAVALLGAEPGAARILAGGQSLMPMLNFRLAQPALLVDINRIADGAVLRQDADGLTLGPLVRHADLLRHCAAGRGHPLLAAALPLIAHSGIRNRGTVCGSLALADPAAELPACAVALDAELDLVSPRGTRRIGAEAFFRGIYETALAEDEMIAAVRFPPADPNWRWTCLEVARRQGDFAIAGLAAGFCATGAPAARLVAFGVAERPLRLAAAEAALTARGSDAAVATLADLDLLGGGDYPAAYRRQVLGTLLTRAAAALGAPA